MNNLFIDIMENEFRHVQNNNLKKLSLLEILNLYVKCLYINVKLRNKVECS